jgi:hypothetical protein
MTKVRNLGSAVTTSSGGGGAAVQILPHLAGIEQNLLDGTQRAGIGAGLAVLAAVHRQQRRADASGERFLAQVETFARVTDEMPVVQAEVI